MLFRSAGYLPGHGPDFWVVGLIMLGIGSTTSAINFVVTILNMRAPGMTLMRMPVFVWMMLIVAFLTVIADSLIDDERDFFLWAASLVRQGSHHVKVREVVESLEGRHSAVGELQPSALMASPIQGAVYVSCSGRGGPHFGAPHAELHILREALGDVPLVGFFAAGEIAHRQIDRKSTRLNSSH